MLKRKLFHLTNGTLVDLYVGDITTVPLDAVVNIGNSTLSNKNGLNKVILDRAGNDIVQEIDRKINATQKKRLDFGEVLLTGGGRLASKKIIHTVGVTFKNAHVTDVAAVRKVMQTCLKKAKAEKFNSLGFPAIGTGKSYFKHDECIDAYVSELKSWRSSSPKEIHFVVYSESLFNEIQATFNLHFSSPSNVTGNSSFYVNNSLSSNRKRKNRTSKNSASSGSLFQNDNVQKNTLQNNSSDLGATGGAAATFVDTVSSDPTVPNDTCTICLCDFTDRKTLKKCGHSFCSACIDQSFASVGPSCPICQTVYGKVIGLQPPGNNDRPKKKPIFARISRLQTFCCVLPNTKRYPNAKNGCPPDQANEIVRNIREHCPNLKFEGLMTIGSFNHDPSKGPNPDFQKLIECRKNICEEFQLNPENLHLSMGMSNDFEHAIEVGSSSVRVGSLIFGARQYTDKAKEDNPETNNDIK